MSGLTPTIAISQQAPSRNPRSTVGTLTEIHDDYRLLFARAGTRRCPRCGVALRQAACPRCGFAGRPHPDRVDVLAELRGRRVPAVPGARLHARVRPGEAGHGPVDAARGRRAGRATRPGRFYGDPHGQHMATLAAAGRALRPRLLGAVERSWTKAAARSRSDGAGERVFDVEWEYVPRHATGHPPLPVRWPGLLALRARRVRAQARRSARRGDGALDGPGCLRRVRRREAEARVPGRPLRGHRYSRAARRRRSTRAWRLRGEPRSGCRSGAQPIRGSARRRRRPPAAPRRRRPRVPDARPTRDDAFGRRSAARAAGRRSPDRA